MMDDESGADRIEKLLQQGIAAARAGRRREARRYLSRALDEDARNETAWLWLAWLAREPHHTLIYLNQVLTINPENRQAQAALEWARQKLKVNTTPPPQTVTRWPASIWTWGLMLAFLSTVLVGLVLVGVVALTTGRQVWAQALASSTPTSTPTATSTFTPIPTATATSTPTPLPTATSTPSPTPTPTITPTPQPEKWIDINLTTQTLVAYDEKRPVFSTLVSSGKAGTSTVPGTFRLWVKIRQDKMEGGSRAKGDYYRLENVPYIMYYYKAYALHGTYWHMNFGQPMSHGCVNLRTEDAEWLFNWTHPFVPEGVNVVYASEEDPGTRVVIHY